MKRKKITILAICIMTMFGVFGYQAITNDVKANINPHCPNGCIENRSQWCYCFGYHRAEEYTWPAE